MKLVAATIIGGLLLVVVGVSGALVASSMVDTWWYALIPAFIGIPLVVCGFVARRMAALRTPALIIAPLIAVVGIVGSFMPSGLNFSEPGSVAFVSSIFRLVTILICGAVLLIAVRAFLRNRGGER